MKFQTKNEKGRGAKKNFTTTTKRVKKEKRRKKLETRLSQSDLTSLLVCDKMYVYIG
jgi:hypothetical protein